MHPSRESAHVLTRVVDPGSFEAKTPPMYSPKYALSKSGHGRNQSPIRVSNTSPGPFGGFTVRLKGPRKLPTSPAFVLTTASTMVLLAFIRVGGVSLEWL